MGVIKELIRKENNGTVSFGDYSLNEKTKKDGFEFAGDTYKVKTFKDITKLEKNEMFVYESVPGTAVSNFKTTDNEVSFDVDGTDSAEITLGLEPETEYETFTGDKATGTMKTNLGGKLTISVELTKDCPVAVKIIKK